MRPPRSAFGASPPGGGQRLRTGRAGSAASAWSRCAGRGGLQAGVRSVLLCGLLVGGAQVAIAGDSRTPLPVIERAAAGTHCVDTPAVMRRTHMDLLRHQRDDTVRGGIRGAKHSLKDCIACHASVQTASVARAESNFCVSCHSYAAVKIDCFECHSSQPRALAQGAPK